MVIPVSKVRHLHPVVWAIVLVAIAAAMTALVLSGGDRESNSDAYLDGRAIRISPKVSGQVITLPVDDDVFVKEGDVLLEIDPADYQAKVDQASAAVATAQNNIDQAKATVLRVDAAVGEAEAPVRAADTETDSLSIWHDCCGATGRIRVPTGWALW